MADRLARRFRREGWQGRHLDSLRFSSGTWRSDGRLGREHKPDHCLKRETPANVSSPRRPHVSAAISASTLPYPQNRHYPVHLIGHVHALLECYLRSWHLGGDADSESMPPPEAADFSWTRIDLYKRSEHIDISRAGASAALVKPRNQRLLRPQRFDFQVCVTDFRKGCVGSK